MSVESMAIALHHSRSKGTAKVVLLGIANHDGDGGAYPTVATLAKYANVSRANVQKALTKLESLGEIRRDVQAGGSHDAAEYLRPNLYRFLLECPADCDRSRGHRAARSSSHTADTTQRDDDSHTAPQPRDPASDARREGASDARREGASNTRRDRASQTRPKPSREPSREPSPEPRGGAHEHEPNARRAIATLIAERRLPANEDELLEVAYRIGSGDPWSGYMRIKFITEAPFDGARDPRRVLMARLRDAA
ncbi:MAG: hypothetical protein CMF56_07115 [Leifsonia sp.]|nr:hypothetical protein [Leifsonia sp.]|tara:strand:+ start:99701 stop:100456 length:756 start_codon:yes stop_codon:yes gene_type:complete